MNQRIPEPIILLSETFATGEGPTAGLAFAVPKARNAWMLCIDFSPTGLGASIDDITIEMNDPNSIDFWREVANFSTFSGTVRLQRVMKLLPGGATTERGESNNPNAGAWYPYCGPKMRVKYTMTVGLSPVTVVVSCQPM